MRPYRLISASAGTGKTYQLTGQFLSLLSNGVRPERVLATTFTRKAAGEILDRVLRRLVEAAEDEHSCAELNAQIGAQGTPPEEYRLLLAGLARRLDRFKIRTLDAFFVHLAKLYALDLGLPADWSIVEKVEDEALRRESVARALTSAPPDEWIELLRGLQRADASRSVENVLLQTVREGRDGYLDSLEPAWHKVAPPPGLSEEAFAVARAGLEAMEVPTTKAGKPVKHWQNAKERAIRAVEGGDWEAFLTVGPVKKLIEGETEFSRHLITKDVRAVLEPLTRQAGHEIVARAARQNAATYRWLDRFEHAYGGVKREERAYRFEDLPQALAPRGEDRLSERNLDMWYRLDGRIDHLLLDEFQDTSPTQWRILERIAGELFDGTGSRTFFCVGDVKQSIYGFREAEPRLLASLPERYPPLALEELTKSYRSSQVVLDTVNQVFARIGQNGAFEREAYRAAALGFQDEYQTHESAKELSGAAYLIEAPPAREDEDGHMPTLRLAAERAAAIVREAPAATVGILLRRNVQIPQLIYLLRRHGLRASGEGGNPLVDSAAVLHLVSLMHLADHPRDSAAAFHVATSPLGAAVGLPREHDRDQAEVLSRSVRTRLSKDGYGAFCASLRDAVSAAYGEWDQRRFDQLVDLAFAFETRASLRPSLFVDHVRATMVEDPTATQIKVMTIHAAKGLEFDAVILPELDERFFPVREPFMRQRPDPAGLLEGVSVGVSRNACTLDPEGLGEMRREEDERGLREVLCLLYVAMTRAARRIDMLVRYQKSGGVRHTFAGIVRDALGARTGVGGGELWSHEASAETWFDADVDEAAPVPDVDDTPRAVGSLFRPTVASRAPGRMSPSGQEGGGRLSVQTLLRPRRSAGRTRGNLVHRWLEEVEWLDSFVATDEELLALGASLEPDEAVRRAALVELRAALERPATRELLTCPVDVECAVWRERDFSLIVPDADGNECHWTGSFDRVVVECENGEPVRAEVIDFKTDAVIGSGIDERVAFYAPQLEAYRSIVARMAGLKQAKVAGTLLFLGPDEVRRL
ncbi:MAG: UvrD-helicase domain-containing protein [bacterium]|nr:UvrD-helicase domain-containing protein [bacterium]